MVLRCRRCKSTEIERSHSKSRFEHYFLRMLFLRPYRCRDCYSRFYSLALFQKRLKQR